MTWLLVVAAGLVAFGGFAMLTQATQGVGLIALGCLTAILARIAQAGGHQRELLKALGVQPAPAILPPQTAPCPRCGSAQPVDARRCAACEQELEAGLRVRTGVTPV
jgi:hypothetical protein